MNLIDTNILVHAYNKDSPHRSKAIDILKELIQGKHVISVQNILEFYSTITKRVSSPLEPKVAKEKATRLFRSNAKKIMANYGAVSKALELAADFDLKGGEIFDAMLVATMLEYDIKTILTENENHFNKYPIKAKNPFKT